MTPVGRAEVEVAGARIGTRVRCTPVLEIDVEGVPVVAKLELLQHTGSFKPRGAFNKMLADQVPPAGVVAASGGNHGLAVAYAAAALGYPAEIFVPHVTPQLKRDRISELGAVVVVEGDLYDDALQASRRRLQETGAREVHAYDDPLVVAGQGTVGREIDQQVPDVEVVLVAVGGGGLIAGVAAWMGGRCRVVGVEPVRSAALHAALAAGAPCEVPVSGVAADSLGARQVGAVPFAVAQAHVEQVVLVSDEAITAAQRWLWAQVRLVAEPGGATALAALLSGAYAPPPGERVAVLVCGANTDPAGVAGSVRRPG